MLVVSITSGDWVFWQHFHCQIDWNLVPRMLIEKPLLFNHALDGRESGPIIARSWTLGWKPKGCIRWKIRIAVISFLYVEIGHHSFESFKECGRHCLTFLFLFLDFTRSFWNTKGNCCTKMV